MNEFQYYKHAEIVLHEDYFNEIFVVIRTKCSTQPSGKQSWCYQLETEDGKLFKDGDSSWVQQNRLKKFNVPSDFSYTGLMTILNDVVERGDFS